MCPLYGEAITSFIFDGSKKFIVSNFLPSLLYCSACMIDFFVRFVNKLHFCNNNSKSKMCGAPYDNISESLKSEYYFDRKPP